MLDLIDSVAVEMRERRHSLNLQLTGVIDVVLGQGERQQMTTMLPSMAEQQAVLAISNYQSSANLAISESLNRIAQRMPGILSDDILSAARERFAGFTERQSREDAMQVKEYVRKVALVASLLRQNGYALHTSIINARRRVKSPVFKLSDRRSRRYSATEMAYLSTRRLLIDLHSTAIAIQAMKQGKRYVYLGEKRIKVTSLFIDEKNLPHPRTDVLLRLQK